MKKTISVLAITAFLFTGAAFSASPFQKKVDAQRTIRSNAFELRQKLKNVQTSNDSSAIVKAEKALLTNEVRRLENRLELSRGRVLQTEYTDKKAKTEILNKLEQKTQWVAKLKSGLEKMENVQDQKQLQNFTDKIRKDWVNEGENAKFRRTIIESKFLRTEEIIARAEKLINDLETEVVRLEGKGLKSTEAKKHLESAKSNLKASRDSQKSAQQTIKKITPDVKKLESVATQARKELKASQNSLLKTQNDLSKANKELKEVKKK